MPVQVPITPIYARGDLVEMMDAEYKMLTSHVEDLTEDQLRWRPNDTAHSIMDVLRHLSYEADRPAKPGNKAKALERLRVWFDAYRAQASHPEKLEERVTWWTGDEMSFRGLLQGFVIRHMAYHYGQIVALRQAMGVEPGKFFHEE